MSGALQTASHNPLSAPHRPPDQPVLQPNERLRPGLGKQTQRSGRQPLNTCPKIPFDEYAGIKGVATRHGIEATFMSKPFTDQSGSGLHVHASLVDHAGRNVLDEARPDGDRIVGHAIAGPQATTYDAWPSLPRTSTPIDVSHQASLYR